MFLYFILAFYNRIFKKKSCMNVIYYSSLVTNELLMEIKEKFGSFPSQAFQKFHQLITEGLSKYTKVYKISSIPIPIGKVEEIDYKKFESENHVYTKYSKNRFVRLFFNFFFSFLYTIEYFIKNRNCVGVFDYLNQSVTLGGYIACSILGVKKIVIVTDLPDQLDFENKVFSKKSILNYIKYKFLNSFDMYILLTEQMNEIVNKRGKPYIIIEGLVDYNIAGENVKKENIILYAGGLYEIYGIKKLVDAFCELDINDFELHVYGNGDIDEYLKKMASNFSNFKFFGEVPNREIVEKLPKCKILVNPRPSNLELTKYSFPSKIMEYMVSGSAVLTTKLPGIPEEYDDFLYYFEDETFEGFKQKLKEITRVTESELYFTGSNGKKFVLENKNHYVQCNKIYHLITQKK